MEKKIERSDIMRVAFILVNYNNFNISINNVYNILSLDGNIKRDIFVVDNASEKDDIDNLEKGLPKYNNVKLLKSDKNLGYFGGLNYGLKQLEYKKYDYIVIANNDLIYRYDFLVKLSENKYKDNCLAIVPELITINGKYQNPQLVNKPSKFRLLGYNLYYTCYFLSIIIELIYGTFFRKKSKESRRISNKTDIFLCTGACIVLNSKFIDKCGYLDDSVFMWGEEVLIAHQIEVAKGVMTYDPSLYVLHFENATVRKISSKKTYQLNKKSFKVYKKYYK